MSGPALVGQAVAIVLAAWAFGAFVLIARLLSPDSGGWRDAKLRVVWLLDLVGIFWGVAALVAWAQPSIVTAPSLALAALFAVGGSLLLGRVALLRRPRG